MDNQNKKYSKISSALKCCFLYNLYYNGYTIKQAAARCNLNYSTAKIILRDLQPNERNFVRRMAHKRISDERSTLKNSKQCSFKVIQPENKQTFINKQNLEIISRIGYNFFEEEPLQQIQK